MGDAETVIEWWGPGNYQYRIQTKQIPGSAHWNVMLDIRGDGGSWSRQWAKETRSKPEPGEFLE